jgi:hypothetical protein
MKPYVRITLAVALCALGAVFAVAQAPVKVQKAELSINFGIAKGELITAGDLLVFVDQEMADSSFSIEKSNISGWTEADGVITVSTNKPVKDRSGERSRFAFRLLEGNSAALAAWYREPGKNGAAPATAEAAAATAQMTKSAEAAAATAAGVTKPEFKEKSYPAKQKRFPVGSTEGRLVIQEKQIAFEANGDTKRSRIWELKDIKALKQTGPYRLEIEPFIGDTYNVELLGEGMTPSEFKALQDRVVAARLTKEATK